MIAAENDTQWNEHSLAEPLQERVQQLLAADPRRQPELETLGKSREGRDILGLRTGTGERRVSLLAGCHADEPVGPRLLRRLTAYLTSLAEDDPLRTRYEWWIIPHINPDGEERNRLWQAGEPPVYDLASYLENAVREQPGDDIEFNFPRHVDDEQARPENRAAYDWWRSADGPFSLHVSLHGMAFAAGPWFLIEPAWRDRYDHIRATCAARVRELGYRLHDVERQGEKGFFRLEPGFCTRPDSKYMREYFLEQGDERTAELFLPSSMECIRSLGGDPLTLVSEMPLFITPGVGEALGPPDPVAEAWRERIADWRQQLAEGGDGAVTVAAHKYGLRPMAVQDQMLLQWTFIAAGLEQVERESPRSTGS